MTDFPFRFDIDVHSHIPSSTILSTGFLVKTFKAESFVTCLRNKAYVYFTLRLPRGSVWYERPCISDLAYTDDAVLLGNSYREVQDLLEAGNRHAATVCMHINVSRAKAMSALTPGEQR